MKQQKNILIIQTAFIGDTILATSLVEETRRKFPDASIHMVIRKGNEAIIRNNPNVNQTWVWDKKGSKYLNLFKLIFKIRKTNFYAILNIHRHASSAWICLLTSAKFKVGFRQNPLSFFFTHKAEHKIPSVIDGRPMHEVQRNIQLLNFVTGEKNIPKTSDILPKMYFTDIERQNIKIYNQCKYVVITPASVWFTKQWPKEKWQELVKKLHEKYTVYLLGSPAEFEFCEEIRNNLPNVENLCKKISLTESAALMENAVRTFANDSSALHLASAVNAPTTAIFNSTAPEQGFFPLSTNSVVVETRPECKPCGSHGHNKCPLVHYKCAMDIKVDDVVNSI